MLADFEAATGIPTELGWRQVGGGIHKEAVEDVWANLLGTCCLTCAVDQEPAFCKRQPGTPQEFLLETLAVLEPQSPVEGNHTHTHTCRFELIH
jgi:hypothetical protein